MMHYKENPIQKPSTREKRTLRLMILAGVFSIFFFIGTLLLTPHGENGMLYILLLIPIFYSCLKCLHEWYHYFSIAVPETATAAKNYQVDIFTTWCPGEPYDMLEQTLTAIQEITYPHTAWCCDEGNDPVVKAMCDRLHVKHVTRKNRLHAKAGNINNALQFATGELCVILDPDHVPAPVLLDHIVPHFNNQQVGFVQIVQAYYNHHENLIAKGAAQQTYQFYGPMMMGMQAYGTVQAIGANCIFRRSALDAIGGHATGLAEDMNTAMHLHAQGWRSVYVPAVLTRGLVPASLSAYYKQQLKWSRGTFELLFTTYPKFFRQFTWRQKLHYFTLPFHYLGGLIFLINFLIPVLSLFTGEIPLHMDIVNFALAGFPLVAMTMLIRQYVQKWVAEETERGIHVVGGLLQIGTWWVHLTGFVYTLFRKKVPYIPTPKDGSAPTPLKLHLPNVIVVIVSMSAIIYGLSNDYNPFTMFMATLAAVNILFMLFIFYASAGIRKTASAFTIQKKIKTGLWLLRHQLYAGIRHYALALSVLVMLVSFFAYRQQQLLPTVLPDPMPGHQVFYAGIFQPADDNGLTSVQQIIADSTTDKRFAIVSFYIPWGAALPVDSFQQVYKTGAVPMITWEPWPSGFGDTANGQVCNKILAGNYDDSILSFATQVASQGKPVFVRFAHEPDNERYPWSPVHGNTPAQYVAAWHHVHDLFDKAGAGKVIWVWNPWKATTATDYFPGTAYVDWLAVDVLDYDQYNPEKISLPFDSLYRPFHQLPVFQLGLPVMVAEAGTLSPGHKVWWEKAKQSIDTAFHEIKSMVVFNNKYDHYYPDGFHPVPLDWSLNKTHFLNSFPQSQLVKNAMTFMPDNSRMKKPMTGKLPDTMKAVVYDKGYHWFRNRHALNRREVENDMEAMKSLSINTLVRTVPGIYDHTIFKAIRQYDMNMIARLWLSTLPEYINDPIEMNSTQNRLLEVVKKYRHEQNIIAWNLGNDVLHSLGSQYFKPDYFYYRNNYMKWLTTFCKAIKTVDPGRPITMDIYWDQEGQSRLSYYRQYLPQIDYFILTADSSNKALLQEPLPSGCIWGTVPADWWHLLPPKQTFILPAWQDIENRHFIVTQGLLDLEGRQKPGYDTVAYYWAGNPIKKTALPDVKILKPAKITNENSKLIYNALIRKGNAGWQFFDRSLFPDIRLEWYLIRTDQFGNTLYMKKAGEGPYLVLYAPKDAALYRLYLKAISGNRIKEASSKLNIPLN
jgi:cellulose synthase/poly-beta-1,6-N-acetylglucosamine synthase-like glycosyltransferase/beta-mannanase